MHGPDSNDGRSRPPPQMHEGDPNASAELYAALSDIELFGRLTAGDRRAWDVLYDRHWRNVRDFIRKQYSRDEHAAEDIASEMFLRLWERRRSVKETPYVLSYLKGAARNVMIDRRRRRTVNIVGEPPADVPSPLPSPDELLERKESGRRLDRAMGALPKSHRTALELSTFTGLSAKEIANHLGCTPNAARRIIQKAKAKLSLAESHCGGSCAVDAGHPEHCPARTKNIDCTKLLLDK